MKRFITIVLVLSLMMGLCTVFASADTSDTVSGYVPKIVSLVYDSSGSMSTGGKWCYANYGLQIIAGLLNDEDQLYVTYMGEEFGSSEPIVCEVNLGDGKRQTWIDTIRADWSGRYYQTYTPISSIDKAWSQLCSVSAGDDAEYWLVIFTDGVFNEYSGYTAAEQKKEIERKLQGYNSVNMPNGSKAKVIYMAISDGSNDVISISSDNSHNILSYNATTNEIVDRMSEMADEVSGRYRLASNEISGSGTKEIQVRSDLPLTNISLLLQNTSAKLLSIEDASGKSYNPDRNLAIGYAPEPGDGYTTDTSLNGTIVTCNNGGSHLPAGTYTMTFDGAVDTDTLDILFDPAISVQTILWGDVDGDGEMEQLDDAGQLYMGMEYKAETVVVETGTDNVIDSSVLEEYGVSAEIEISEDGTVVDNRTGMSFEGTVGSGNRIEIVTEVTIGDFPAVTGTLEFTPNGTYRSSPYTGEIILSREEELVDGDEIDANAVLHDTAGNEIKLKDLPKGSTVTFSYSDGQSSDSLELKDITLAEGNGTFTLTVSVPGYQDLIITRDITIEHRAEWSVTVDSGYEPFRYDLSEDEHTDAIPFTVTKDGVPATVEEIEAAGYHLSGIGDDNYTADVREGQILITPQEYHWWYSLFPPTRWGGRVNVKVEIEDGAAATYFKVKLPWWFWVVVATIVLVILYAVAWAVTRLHFPQTTVTQSVWNIPAPPPRRGLGGGRIVPIWQHTQTESIGFWTDSSSFLQKIPHRAPVRAKVFDCNLTYDKRRRLTAAIHIANNQSGITAYDPGQLTPAIVLSVYHDAGADPQERELEANARGHQMICVRHANMLTVYQFTVR